MNPTRTATHDDMPCQPIQSNRCHRPDSNVARHASHMSPTTESTQRHSATRAANFDQSPSRVDFLAVNVLARLHQAYLSWAAIVPHGPQFKLTKTVDGLLTETAPAKTIGVNVFRYPIFGSHTALSVRSVRVRNHQVRTECYGPESGEQPGCSFSASFSHGQSLKRPAYRLSACKRHSIRGDWGVNGPSLCEEIFLRAKSTLNTVLRKIKRMFKSAASECRFGCQAVAIVTSLLR